MTKPLPTIPGFDAPAGIGHNNPPEPTVDLDKLKELDGQKLYREGLLAPTVNDLKDEAAAFVADATTEEGRKAIKSFAYRLTRSKNILDEKGKEINDTLRVHINAVDERRRIMRKEIDELIATIEKPLTEWETKEQLRKNKLDADLAKVKNAIVFFKEPSLAEIDERIATLKGFDGHDWQEYGEAPKGVIEESLQFLNEKRTLREQQIKDQEELSRLRAAEASRQVAPQPFISDPAAQHTTDSQKPDVFNIVKAIVPDADHRKEINGRVLNAIMSLPVPVDESQAKAIVIAIVQGKIPNVTINY